jgi:two-component system sensor histidine kinase PilS (NtrC family)
VTNNPLFLVKNVSGDWSPVNFYVWWRGAFLFLASAGLFAVQIHYGDFLIPDLFQPLLLILTLLSSVQLLIVLSANQKWVSELRILECLFYVDAIAAIFVVSLLPHVVTPFLFWGMIWSGVCSFLLGPTKGIRFGLFLGSLFALAWAANPVFSVSELRFQWFIHLFGFVALSGMGGALSLQFKSLRGVIADKDSDLERLSEFQRIVSENIPSGIVLLNSSHQVVSFNPRAESVFFQTIHLGIEVGLLNKEIYEHLNHQLRVAAPAGIPLNSSFQHFEVKQKRPPSGMAVLDVVATQIKKDEDPLSPYVLLLVQDVTEVRHLQDQIKQNEKLAAVGQLAAGIAHEIRNPLASISGSVQLLAANRSGSSDDQKLYNIVIKEIDRLNGLITEFLDYVRPDVRGDDTISLNELLKNVLQLVGRDPKLPKDVEQKWDLKSTQLINGHFDKLKQAFLNIVINAYQAMNDVPKKEISILTRDEGSKVVVEISDTGCGMSSDTQKRIFEPFHTTKPGGTGLGLSITHKILQTHEASITVFSAIGTGTTFHIEFFGMNMTPEQRREKLKVLGGQQ